MTEIIITISALWVWTTIVVVFIYLRRNNVVNEMKENVSEIQKRIEFFDHFMTEIDHSNKKLADQLNELENKVEMQPQDSIQDVVKGFSRRARL